MLSQKLSKQVLEDAIMEKKEIRELRQSVELIGGVVERMLGRMDEMERLFIGTMDGIDSMNDIVPSIEEEEDQPASPTIVIRHSRYYDADGSVSNLGGVTYAFRILHDLGMVDVGVSICNKQDNFSRNYGYCNAMTRLINAPMSFPFQSNGEYGLVDSFWNAFNEGYLSGDPDMRAMIEVADVDGLDAIQ